MQKWSTISSSLHLLNSLFSSLFLLFCSSFLFLGACGLALLGIKHYGYAKEVHFGMTAEERSRQALGDDANIIHVEIGTSLHT